MTRRFKGMLYPIFAIAAFATIIILLVELPRIYPAEDWTTIRTDFIQVMPWLIMFGSGIIALTYISRDRPSRLYAFTIPAAAVVGVGSAMLMRTLYDLGIILDEITAIHTTVTITDLQFLAILGWTVAGLIVGVLRER